jgi:hypothetical protein
MYQHGKARRQRRSAKRLDCPFAERSYTCGKPVCHHL